MNFHLSTNGATSLHGTTDMAGPALGWTTRCSPTEQPTQANGFNFQPLARPEDVQFWVLAFKNGAKQSFMCEPNKNGVR